jgi:uracil-DNA glycosylase family 4
MLPTTPHFDALSHSLVDWLYLAGLQAETSSQPRHWLQDTEQAPIIAAGFAEELQASPLLHSPVTAAPIKVPAAPVLAVVSLPNFINLESYNSFITSYKTLDICKTSNKTLLGVGSLQPDLMVVADTPNDTEDRCGESFTSLGHQNILQALDFAGFSKEKSYYTYLSKWRPPGQRPLTKLEVHHLAPLLIAEINLVRPKALLLLGESIARALLGESAGTTVPLSTLLLYQNQLDNKEIPVWASQRGENLVKTQSMKKSFWFSILSFKAALSARGLVVADTMTQRQAHHNLEYISDVH